MTHPIRPASHRSAHSHAAVYNAVPRPHFLPHEAPAEVATAAPAVLLAGPLTAMAAPGGGEVQMASLGRALSARGVECRYWRPWEESLDGIGCLHLFGSVPEHLPVVRAAKRRGIPVALSTIAWFSLTHCWRQSRPWPARFTASARFLGRAMFPELPTWRRRLYHAVDLLMPNSHAEAAQLVRYFELPAQKIRIVPNGADPRFAHGDASLFAERYGLRDFILYAGRIEPRKNQLGFLRAIRGLQLPVVMLGDVVPGHEAYAEQCRREADASVHWICNFSHCDPLLVSAYHACRCLVLASWFETPGLVAMEAGMSGAPLVLTREGCADEYFGRYATYVDPRNPIEIRQAVLAAMEKPRNRLLAEHLHDNFSWDVAAEVTLDAYRTICPAIGE